MKHLILCTLLYFLSSNLYCQTDCNYLETNYYPLIYEAEISYFQDDKDAAYEKYKEAESKCELRQSAYYQEMSRYLNLLNSRGEYEKASFYLKKLISEYGYSVDTFEDYYDFEKLNLNKTDLEKAYTNFYSKERQKIIDQMIVILENDQVVRRNGMDFLPSEYSYLDNILETQDIESYRLARDSLVTLIKETREYVDPRQVKNPEQNSKRMLVNTDSLNLLKVRKIIKEHGFPDLQLLGDDNFDYVCEFALFRHFQGNAEFEEMMLDQVRKGECIPLAYGYMKDMNIEGNKLTFIYGLYEDTDESNIEDYENVDTRRQSIGLPTRKQILDRDKAMEDYRENDE